MDLTSSERVAYTFPLIAAPHVDADVDEGSKTGSDTLLVEGFRPGVRWHQQPSSRNCSLRRLETVPRGGFESTHLMYSRCVHCHFDALLQS